MTAAYNVAECFRLIAELREDDARITPGPYRVVDSVRVESGPDDNPTDIVYCGDQVDGAGLADLAGISRTRNNLKDLADQLEAACSEVDRLKEDVAAHRNGWTEDGVQRISKLEAERDEMKAERDEMKAERDEMKAERDEMKSERDDALDERDEMRLARDMQIKRGNEYADEVSRLVAERDALQAALTKAKDEHIGDAMAWFEREHALTMERNALSQQLETSRKSRDAMRDTIAMIDRDSQTILAALLRCEAERDSLRSRVAELDGEAHKLRNSGAHHIMRVALDDNERLEEERNSALTALRAILPVYRSVRAWDDWIVTTRTLRDAIDTARTAITPEIVAVMAEVEMDGGTPEDP